ASKNFQQFDKRRESIEQFIKDLECKEMINTGITEAINAGDSTKVRDLLKFAQVKQIPGTAEYILKAETFLIKMKDNKHAKELFQKTIKSKDPSAIKKLISEYE